VYPNLIFEASTGIQVATTHLGTSGEVPSETSTGRQLTYQTIASVTYSFPCAFGLLAAVEWDAPLNSVAFRGSSSFYANTAVFTGGLVYNIFAGRLKSSSSANGHPDASSWSASLLYSYTAFDPLYQTNQVQVQFSYTF
jgi:hypothetical protein